VNEMTPTGSRSATSERGPLGGQYRRANVLVAVAQEGLVQIEMFDELCQHLLTGLSGGRGVRFQPPVGDGDDEGRWAGTVSSDLGTDTGPGGRTLEND
jgi:hypothetical protein